MTLDDYTEIAPLLVALERDGLVTRTFRRLDPDRQTAVIRAIFDEASEIGPSALNIKRVAERAGVAVGSLYQYFGSRNGLLDFAVELVTRAVAAAFQQYRPLMAQLPLREALKAYGEGALEWARSSPGFVAFFARAAYGGDPALRERVVRPVASALLGMMEEALRAAEARGELRPGADAPAAARALYAQTIALYDPILLPYLNTYFQVYDGDFPAERTLRAALEITLNGIARQA